MAKILIIEDDAVFAAVLEDRLHVAGHGVVSTADSQQAFDTAGSGGVDLVILKMELDGAASGLEIMQTLRGGGATRSLPIVVVSNQTDSREKVAALRAGADEYLSQPVDLEELLIRVDRLLGSRRASPSIMQGDLTSHPTWELMQFVQQAGKSGELVIRGPEGTGHVQLGSGRVTSARFKKLEGRDALLALLALKEGNFQLTTDELTLGSPPAAANPSSIPIPEVLMASAWLEDEIKKRQEFLPATGVPLDVLQDDLPELDPELAEIPIDKVFARLLQAPCRLFDLISEGGAAPSKIRLAVAWLIEQKAVSPARGPAEQFMTTTEISSTMVLDVAVHNLLGAACKAGFEPDNLPYLILVEEDVWPHLQKLLERVPGFKRLENLPRLIEQVGLRQGGSANFESDLGSLSLHVQILKPEVKAQVESILSVCAGVLLWLDEAKERELIQAVIQRLETVASATTGVLVAHRPEQQETIAALAAGHGRWQSSGHAPQSLIGVLRLLHPRM